MDKVIAKAGVKWVGQGVNAFADQPHQQGGIPRRRTGVDGQSGDMAIASKQADLKPAATLAAVIQLRGGFARQRCDGVEDIMGARYGFGEVLRDADDGHMTARRDARILLLQ